ncbi:hypothetical protein Tco_1418144 [Tanacetum coccineum]
MSANHHKSSLAIDFKSCAFFWTITAIEKLGKWWNCQLGTYTWGGGDSGGGGDVLPKSIDFTMFFEELDLKLLQDVVRRPYVRFKCMCDYENHDYENRFLANHAPVVGDRNLQFDLTKSLIKNSHQTASLETHCGNAKTDEDMVKEYMAERELQFRASQKLSAEYYGPFQVIAKVGAVAYTLKVLPNAAIHPTFHVSLLKKHIGPIVPEATLSNTHSHQFQS